jgi:hypothetical protein
MDQAETILARAIESGQLSALVSALKEKGVLSGKRIERAEIGAPGEPAFHSSTHVPRQESPLHRSDCELHRTVTNAFNFNIPADVSTVGMSALCQKQISARLISITSSTKIENNS